MDKSLPDIMLEARDRVMEGWCTGHRAEDASGECMVNVEKFLDPWDPAAAKWCLIGAIEAAQGFNYGPGYHFISKYLEDVGLGNYISFNDAPGRTQMQVAGLLDDAARAAKELSV